MVSLFGRSGGGEQKEIYGQYCDLAEVCTLVDSNSVCKFETVTRKLMSPILIIEGRGGWS